MDKPYLLFLLLKLAELGATRGHVNAPTKTLGELLETSQQTASRNIKELDDLGWIDRYITKGGQFVKLTQAGMDQLSTLYKPLVQVFEKPQPIVIVGKVMTGTRDGQYYMKVYEKLFQRKLGFTPYPGTLNIRATTVEDLKTLQKLRLLRAIEIEEFANKGRVFGAVRCWKAKIGGKVSGALILPVRTHHEVDVAELIAPLKLRDKLGLKDGDDLRVEAYLVS